MPELSRSLEPTVRAALRTFRVVFLGGPRQAGKTTLARVMGSHGARRRFVTLDDLAVLDAARRDPLGFIEDLPTPATIDEIQRVPELLLAIKARVDRGREPGAYLLTGSADPSAVARVRDELAGRTALLRLDPLTIAERRGRPEWNPVDSIFASRSARELLVRFDGAPAPMPLDQHVLVGGFPEPVLHLGASRRAAWHDEYVKTYVERDVPQFVHLDQVTTFLRFVRLVTAATASVLNQSRVARDAGVSNDTAKRWLSVLESTYLAFPLPAFWRNVRKRLTKSPKLHFVDTGLASALLGARTWKQAERSNLAGAFTETWVHHHLRSFAAASKRDCRLSFFRSATGDECDFVLECGARLVPIEVKSSRTPRVADTKGLRVFRDLFPKECPFGILLHGGQSAAPLGRGIVSLPLATFLGGPARG